MVITLNEDQQWDNQLRGAAEGHVPASQGLTKHGPLEKGIANHFIILALRTPWTVWKGKMIDICQWDIHVFVALQDKEHFYHPRNFSYSSLHSISPLLLFPLPRKPLVWFLVQISRIIWMESYTPYSFEFCFSQHNIFDIIHVILVFHSYLLHSYVLHTYYM